MNENKHALLEAYKAGTMTTDEVIAQLDKTDLQEMGFATLDHHRAERVGYPEVIYCEHKTTPQVTAIFKALAVKGHNVLATRISKEAAESVLNDFPSARYNALGRTLVLYQGIQKETSHKIAIVSAGTSDLNVVEEAYETALCFGNRVDKIVDVGVAGIHRLFNKLELIREARVIIVVAGMEGALASVLGGLVDKPVIAVPTSVGYGASFNGLSALLTMLNSCASGITVVNIDNGFGAAYAASQINQL
jgi:NCAIR mutase (PurE)-related protein